MAVQQLFYAAFAEYLATQGYRVWTFDYQGIGESKQGAMRACKATISTWINADYEAVVMQAGKDMSDLPLYVLGHSLGGLITPFLPSIKSISGIINIAIGSGATRHIQSRLQPVMPLLWHVLTPLLCPVFGYFPGSKIGVVGDVPQHAMFEWRRWCLNPEYLLDAAAGARPAYAAIQCPVLNLFFTDDELLLVSGGRFMNEAYTGTEVEFRTIEPADVNTDRIGHFGFFKARQQEALWPVVTNWLEKQSNT